MTEPNMHTCDMNSLTNPCTNTHRPYPHACPLPHTLSTCHSNAASGFRTCCSMSGCPVVFHPSCALVGCFALPLNHNSNADSTANKITLRVRPHLLNVAIDFRLPVYSSTAPSRRRTSDARRTHPPWCIVCAASRSRTIISCSSATAAR